MKCAIALLFLCCFEAEGGFEQRGFGARGAGLASSYLAVADDVWAVRGNAAGLIQIHAFSIGAACSPAPFGMTELMRSEASFAIPASFAVIGLSAGTFGFSLYREFTGSAAAAVKIAGAGVGVTLNYHAVVIQEYGSAAALSYDAGIFLPLTPSLAGGCSLTNVSSSTIGVSREKLPQLFTLGVAGTPFSRLRLFAAYAKQAEFNASVRCGFEYAVVDEVTLRAGMANEPYLASCGFTFRLFGVAVEYGISHHDELGWTQEFSLLLQGGK